MWVSEACERGMCEITDGSLGLLSWLLMQKTMNASIDMEHDESC